MIQATSGKATRSKKPRATDQAAGAIPAAKRFDLEPVGGESMFVGVHEIERHPKNRVPTPEKVARMAESIDQVGQLQDVLLRPHPTKAGRFQLVAGETRWLAKKKLGRAHVSAKVRPMTDPEALAILAIDNAAREDLTPIERAELLAELVKPEAEGGAGMTQEQAGEIYKLSRPAVANAIRLLKLPAKVRDLVGEGRIPETFAREVLGLFDGPLAGRAEKAMLEIAGRWKDLEKGYSRSDFVRNVVDIATRDSRYVEAKRGSHVAGSDYYATEVVKQKGGGWSSQCFDLTPDVREELKVAELPDGRLVATDVEAYRRINVAAAEILLEKFAKRKSKADAKDAKAIAAAKPEDRAKVAAERLKGKLEGLAVDFRGWAAAKAVEQDPRLAAIAALWFACGARDVSFGRRSEVARELGGKGSEWDARRTFVATVDRENAPDKLRALLSRFLFHPGGEGHRPTADLAEALIVAGDVDLEAAWYADSEGDQFHVRRWLEAHDVEALGELLGRYRVGVEAKKAKKRDLVEAGLARATASVFPLPKGYALAKRKGAAS